MRRSGGATSTIASPVLVGAVTVLVTIVAVFLAYNANAGLPFVPTYDLNAEIPGGANLVPGNDVRVGGFRVGAVDDIKPATDPKTGEAVAKIHMKLDKSIEPLGKNTQVMVRPRSALGLKFVEITPDPSDSNAYAAGATIPLANSKKNTDFDDVLNMFDEDTREYSRTALKGYGDALAGRGQSLNDAIGSLRPFFKSLEPVMTNLSDPDTQLDEFFKQIGRASAQVAPVAKTQAQLFVDMADTFEAFSRYPRSLQATIEKAPSTLDTTIASLRVQRPFISDFADVSADLRPAVASLRSAVPDLNDAFRVGEPVVRASVDLNQKTEKVFKALDDLSQNPNTLLALQDATSLVTLANPLVNFIAPYQTVCNSAMYFITPLGTHQSESVPAGTYERVMLNGANRSQPNRVNDYPASRPADVPADKDPQKYTNDPEGDPLTVVHAQPYSPAIDAAGNADCQNGQTGYLDGPLTTGDRYKPTTTDDPKVLEHGGGNHVVTAPDNPGLAGPTTSPGPWKGIKNLKDVP